MNIQLKQKIIGIVVVAVFLAIAIPFLLSGSKNKQTNGSNSNTNANPETLVLPDQQPNSSPANPQPSVPPSDNNANTDQQQNAADVNIDATNQSSNTPVLPTSDPDDAAKNITTDTNNAATQTPHPNTTTAEKNQLPLPKEQSASNPATTMTSSDNAKNPPAPKNININNNQDAQDAPTPNMQVTSTTTPTPTTTAVKPGQNPALQASLTKKENAIVSNTSHKIAKSHKMKTAKKAAKKIKTSNEKNIPHAKKSQWIVRVNTYQNSKQAQNLLKKLTVHNYQATIQTEKVQGKTAFNVILEPLSSKKKAETLAKKVEKHLGIKPKVTEEQVITVKQNNPTTNHKKR